MADDMVVTFYGWNKEQDDQEAYLVVKVAGPEEGCTATKVSGDASGGRMFAKLMAGKEWYSQIDIEDPASQGIFDPTKKKHWRTLQIIFRSVYNHVSIQEGAPA
jgi:hypothetical protein